jgi:hypothetical protein
LTSYLPPASAATRPFVTTPYTADADGRQIPAFPDQGICRDPDVACSLVLDHWRDRKTGPAHPLAVVRCRVHDCAFTLYPRGHVPYGYAAIGSPGLFDAAEDAAAGRPWDREGRGPRWWSTQGRRLARAARITGVADLTARLRERIVEALGVDLIDVTTAAPGYVAQGTAVSATLDRVPAATWRAAGERRCGGIQRQGPCAHWRSGAPHPARGRRRPTRRFHPRTWDIDQ